MKRAIITMFALVAVVCGAVAQTQNENDILEALKKGKTTTPPPTEQQLYGNDDEEAEVDSKQAKVAETEVGIMEPDSVVVNDGSDALMVADGENVRIGAPVVEGVKVTGRVVRQVKGKKIIVFKMKAKKDYRKKQGHRQPYTQVEITAING